MQTALSLADRCDHYRREFPDSHMNPTLLRQIYKLHKCKKKKYRWYKEPPNPEEAKSTRELARVKRELAKAKKDGYRVIYIDETCFTRKTVVDTEWMRPKENIAVDVAMLEEPTLALLCGISKEKGVDHHRVFEFSVNVDKFIEYLDGLRDANGEDKICIFMDNLSAHTSNKSKDAMRELGFRYIYNVAYSPDFNPIEFVFSKVK